jgi:drug/metabolite transporter (DMT)-like permease
MWLLLAFLSAALLGFYDSFKKKALQDNAVSTVLFLNTFFCTLIFVPLIVLSYTTTVLDGSIFHVASGGWEVHKWIILKSVIVLSSWICGYLGMKRVPLTIYGPINATRPVLVLVGAIFVYGERLNVWQWTGVLLAVVSFFMLSRSSKKEGISFRHNKGIWFIVAGAVLGAVSGLYDKFLMNPKGLALDRMIVQSWYNFYQMIMMGIVLAVIHHSSSPSPKSFFSAIREGLNGHGMVTIFMISVFLSAADFVYFYALSLPGAMISIVSMVRRGSVIVSFLFGAAFFHEKNLRSKAVDLALVLLGMIFLWIGGE